MLTENVIIVGGQELSDSCEKELDLYWSQYLVKTESP